MALPAILRLHERLATSATSVHGASPSIAARKHPSSEDTDAVPRKHGEGIRERTPSNRF
jgi:hypothetical protein